MLQITEKGLVFRLKFKYYCKLSMLGCAKDTFHYAPFKYYYKLSTLWNERSDP